MKKYLVYLFLTLSISAKAQISDFGEVDFQKADSIAYHYKGENLRNLPLLSYNLTHNLSSDLEKFRAIYTWVSTNIENDYWAYDRNRKKRNKLQNDSLALNDWNRSFRIKSFKKLAKEKKTVCTGYAYLLRELADLADINCKIIDGYGRTVNSHIDKLEMPNHSWNAVQLNNKWYLCDATWSSGFYDINRDEFVWDYNDGYFLAEPKLFVQSHYPLDESWILMDNKPTISDFLKFPLIYKYAFNYDIIPIKPQMMRVQTIKNESLSFLYKAPDSLKTDKIKLELVSGSNKYTVSPDIDRNAEGLLEIKYTFPRQGYYDVHLKIEGKYIVTYTVRVKKSKK